MQRVADFFSTRTQMDASVEEATNELLLGPDWARNIQICDIINSSGNSSAAADFIRAIRRRLRHKDRKTQELALTLLETSVKNCGPTLHLEVAGREMLQDMERLGTQHGIDRRIRDKALEMIETWAEAFKSHEDEIPMFSELFWRLKRAGVEFPARDVDSMAPVFTPSTGAGPRQIQPQMGDTNEYGQPIPTESRNRHSPPPSYSEAPPSYAQSQQHVNSNALLEQASELSELATSIRQSGSDEGLLQDVLEQCKTLHTNLLATISTSTDENQILRLINANELLLNVINGETSTFPASSNDISQPQHEEGPAVGNLIDLDEQAPVNQPAPDVDLLPGMGSNRQSENSEETADLLGSTLADLGIQPISTVSAKTEPKADDGLSEFVSAPPQPTQTLAQGTQQPSSATSLSLAPPPKAKNKKSKAPKPAEDLFDL